MPHDPQLAQRMREALQSRAGVVEKKMFGGYCWMLHGHMLCGVEVGRFMFRVGKEQEAAALSRPGASVMDITGKPMKGFVWVDAGETVGDGLDTWIEMAARYVGGLPSK
ncbi:MAG: TfoX/Sxy family protein [Rubrivivax sp.]|nr:TfoX/Sxy family protein [Rubrivivax sp.]